MADLILGTPGNRFLCLWPSTSKQGSGVGNTLNAPLAWPWDGHYKSIFLPADEEIMGSSCMMMMSAEGVVCYRAIEASRCVPMCTPSLLWGCLLWALEKVYYATYVWYICSCWEILLLFEERLRTGMQPVRKKQHAASHIALYVETSHCVIYPVT
jgi:hypothetical protein